MTVDTKKVVRVDGLARAITASLNATIGKADAGRAFTRDDAKGEYTEHRGILEAHRTGAVYGVQKPKWTASNSTQGVKTRRQRQPGHRPVSTNNETGRDDYRPFAFRVWDVNATVDDAGVPHVTAIKDKASAPGSADGSNGDAHVMTCHGLRQARSTSTPQHDPQLQRHPVRRLCAIARRAAARRQQTAMPVVREIRRLPRLPATPPPSAARRSTENSAPRTEPSTTRSKKARATPAAAPATTSTSSSCSCSNTPPKTRNVLGGCWQYTPQTAVTKAETGVKRVIIATSSAGNIDIGSTINIGTDKERNSAGNYSAARARTILSKTNLDANNTALNLDGDAITTTTACFVSSMPWKTGATDKLLGTDGRPSDAFAANHQPIRLQGIELFNGIYETDADLIVNAVKESDDKGRLDIYRVFDITKASKTSTANYVQDRRIPGPHQSHRQLVEICRGLHPVQRRAHPHRHRSHQRHRPMRRRIRQPASIPGPPTGAALRPPRVRGCLRRLRREPHERPRGSLVGLRGPPFCARSHEGVAAVRWG